MNFGHCKHCWWWKKTTPIADKAIVSIIEIPQKKQPIAPINNRKNGNKEDGTLDEWINKHPEIQINKVDTKGKETSK